MFEAYFHNLEESPEEDNFSVTFVAENILEAANKAQKFAIENNVECWSVQRLIY